MFSKVAIFACLLAVAICAPAQEPVEIISQDSDIQPDGSYVYSFESADGTKQEQSGVPKPVEKDEVAEVVKGSAVFSDPDGVKHELTYVADENGYQPQSADLPQPPAVPPQITRALEWNANHPEEEE